MDESALRNLLSTLDASRSPWHGRLHVFTFLVIVGLGFDLFVIIKEFWDDWKDFRYGQIHPYEIHLPKRPSVWLLVLGLIGTALIVIGVWGELYVDVQAGKVETQIREANDKLLGLIIQEAGDAQTSAKGAATAAGRAKDAAGKAEGTAEKVNKRAEEISARLDTASQQLAQVEQQVRVQGPRWKLLVDGQKTFVEALRPFKGQRVVLIPCEPRQAPWQLEEEYLFELRLMNLLVEIPRQQPRGAGWDVTAGPPYSCAGSLGIIGVWILYASPAVKEAAEALGTALNKLEINTQTTQVSQPTGTPPQFSKSVRPDDLNALFRVIAGDSTGIYVVTGQNPQIFAPKK